MRPLVVLCGVLAGMGACYFAVYLGVTLQRDMAFPFGDFFALWSYARIGASQPISSLYDPAVLHAAQVAMGMAPAEQNPFPYPPTGLLLLLPLAPLSYGAALVVWMGVTFGLYATATLAWRKRVLVPALIVALAPTTTIAVVSGQNGFLSAALLVGGLRLADRRPALAGVLLGLLTYKPQLGILAPFGLIAAGNWRCVAWACVTIALLIVATSAMLDPAAWWEWVDSLRGYQAMFSQATQTPRLMPTVMADAKWLGASTVISQLIQGTCAVVAAAVVCTCWRRGPRESAIPVLLIATCLATPHAFVYDLPLLTGAVALLVSQKMEKHEAFAASDIVVLVLVLVFPAIMTGAKQHLPIGGIVLAMFLTVAVCHHLRTGLAGPKTGGERIPTGQDIDPFLNS